LADLDAEASTRATNDTTIYNGLQTLQQNHNTLATDEAALRQTVELDITSLAQYKLTVATLLTAIEDDYKARIAALVNSAPEVLDTLKELADAIGNDANFATTMLTNLAEKASIASVSALNDMLASLMTRYEAFVKEITQALAQETQNRIDSDKALSDRIYQEVSDRIDGDNVLNNKIEQVEQARIQADTEFDGKIEQEAIDREAADTRLEGLIGQEAQARSQGDATLQSNINQEAAARNQADATLQSNINTVINTYMPLAGGTFTGNVSMGTKILTVPTPALPS
jgi:hypothetical protein